MQNVQKRLLFVAIVILLILFSGSTGAYQVLSFDFGSLLQAGGGPAIDSNLEGQEDKVNEHTSSDQQGEEGIEVEDDNGEEKKEPNLEEVTDIEKEKKIIEEPLAILVLVNKEWNLSSDFVPSDLVAPDIPFSFSEDLPQKLMRQEAATALEELLKRAAADNISLAGVSGYRSYQWQKDIFTARAKQRGEEVANKTTAYPGQSEHQTGLAMDVSSASINYRLIESFGDTPEGIWLAKNAPYYGFIIRYPKGKEEITGYSYEPWHLRYVGIEAAVKISASDITFEEYMASR